MKLRLTIIFLFITLLISANDKGVIEGVIVNSKNNEPIPFANIFIYGTNIGASSDFDGKFSFTGLQPGYFQLEVTSIGYETVISEPFLITNADKSFIQITMNEESTNLEAVTIKTSVFRKDETAPLSMQRVSIEEIEKNPGGNRDISKVIQSLPGVSFSPAFRNDIIVRGGGPSENRFYIDGVEIPNINHFATQGASGGPVGILNVDFIRNVDFYSGSFPANKDDALSSIISFSQIDGNKDRLKTRATLGSSDIGLTLDGPLGENTTGIFSIRRSYLQLLFSALELPFLPIYNDMQFKTKTRINDKNELTIIGLGAIDLFDLNLEANETEEQQYILANLPVNEQWSYTVGAVWKTYLENGYRTYVVSHNKLNNRTYKYQDNIEQESLLFLDYNSYESEVKLRFERDYLLEDNLRINWGAGLEHDSYYNKTFNKTFVNGSPFIVQYENDLMFYRWGLFGQVTKGFLSNRFTTSLGLRADANSYSNEMSNGLNQISPRLSLSYKLSPLVSLNFNTGRFYQLPSYTTLGFKNNSGALINKENGVKYITADHIVAGVELLPGSNMKFTAEGFYKKYNNYPFSVSDSVSLASKGDGFGVYGAEEITPTGVGQSYGIEFLGRGNDIAGMNFIFSYTFVRSEAANYFGENIPTSWDNVHLLSITSTRKFKNNWEVGAKWRLAGGVPYTPYDLDQSSLIDAWDVRYSAYPDYSKYNQKRLSAFHQLDMRVDKSWYFDNWSFMLYFDIQNLYNFKAEQPSYLIPVTDVNGNLVIDPTDPTRYVLKDVKSETGTVLPSIGIMVEF